MASDADSPPPPVGSLEAASRRLERAVLALERRLDAAAAARAAVPVDADQEALLAEVERLRARERTLTAAAQDAARTLGRAADEIRAVLEGA